MYLFFDTLKNGTFDGMKPRYKRILLKLSGEALTAQGGQHISPEKLQQYTSEIRQAVDLGVEVAVVTGGGNIFRGREGESLGIERVQADYMGMLATLINAMALQTFLEREGLKTRLMSGIQVEQVCEPFIRRRALRHLEKKRVVIFSAGIGNPYFTTDSTASLRAIEIKADVVLKGTKVSGVYAEDPAINPQAERFTRISFQDAYEKGLQVMDMTAFTLCQENNLPIIVFDINKPGNLSAILQGSAVGTLVS